MSQQINLYNPRFRKKTNYVTLNALAIAAGVALAGSLALGTVLQQRVLVAKAEADKVQQQMDVAEKRQKEAGVKAPAQKNPQVAEQLAQAEADNRALHEVSVILEKGEIGNTRGYSAYFSAFARTRVQGLWLTGVQINGAGNDIGLQGRALQAGLLPGYLSGLAREPVLKGKAFGDLEMNQTVPPVAPAAPGAAGAGAAAPAPAAPMPPLVEFRLHAHPGGDASAQPKAEAP